MTSSPSIPTPQARPESAGHHAGRPDAPAEIWVREAKRSLSQGEQRLEAIYSHLALEVQRLTQEMEQSNRALRRNLWEKEKLQAILLSTLQSLTAGVLAVGQDGTVIVANPAACRLIGRALDELATRRIEEVLAGIEGADALLLTLQGAGGGQHSIDWARDGSAGGATRWIELKAVRALPPSDEHLAGLVLVEDRTELHQLQHQAALRNRLTGMGEIAMNLAHEIRNPLGSMALFATALAGELQADESLGPLAGQIVRGVQALEHIVANTLEFARPRRIVMARVDLARVLADTLTYIEHPLRQKNINVDFDADLQVGACIAGDAEQLRQVFLNLTINALQAMEEGGRLEIRLAPSDDGGWTVTVADDGVGIPAEILERIYDPFFTTREKGSGIGLAIVHSIVEAHGARIEVSSRPAAGATFRVTFPGRASIEALDAGGRQEPRTDGSS
jgi:PAS domain S-box-containing protein